MSIISKIIYYLKTEGLLYVTKVAINRLFNVALKLRYTSKDLKNIIIMESHNDFDCNCGAFFNYLIEKGINKKYKIIWLVKNKVLFELPDNVKAINIHKLSFSKNYYICRAKIILYEDLTIQPIWDNQTVIYCTHGISFKNVKGHINVSDKVSYVLSPSANFDPLMCEILSIPFPNDKMIHLGFPSHDVMFSKDIKEFNKFVKRSFKKSILWMPTFRKSKSGRVDSEIKFPYGIPLFDTSEQLNSMDTFLALNDFLLIVKFHPMQDMSNIVLPNKLNNIVFLDAKRAKDLDIDVYRLMACVDAMISDYSSAAYSFLLLDKPIGFVLSDLEQYKIGLVNNNIGEIDILPGEKIYTVDDMKHFINDLAVNADCYAEKRKELTEWLYEYVDGKASNRLAEFLSLEKD